MSDANLGSPVPTSGTPAPKEHHALRNTFRCSIILKGLHALFESVTGTALFFIPGRLLNRIAFRVARLDFLSRNPHDVIGSHLRHMAIGVTGTGRRFAAIYLLSHGLVKLVLVIELLRNRLWAYPLMIVMLSVFIGYQSYRFWLTRSIVMAALTVFDLAVIALTAFEYREQLRLRKSA
jgi:uncharacterized membrane protein